MFKKIKNLSKRNQLLLVGIALLLTLTIIGGLLPLLDRGEELSVEQARKELSNSVWTRKTDDGEDALMFTEFGGLLIGTLQGSNGKLSKDTQWLYYEIAKKDTLTIRNGNTDPSSFGLTDYDGEHKIKFKKGTIEFDDAIYQRLSEEEFSKWLNYYNDYHYWDSWSEEDVKKEDANRQN